MTPPHGRHAACPACRASRSVAAKQEPFLSGLPASRAGLQAALAQALTQAAAHPDGAHPATTVHLVAHLTPRQMAQAMLPHEPWDERCPPCLAFYSFAALMSVPAAGEA